MITYRSAVAGAAEHPLTPSQRADILIEALPYLRQFAGQTLVIKYGGKAMTSPALKEQVAADVALLQYVGMRPVLVHGGGPEIDQVLQQMSLEPKFINGLRVTDDATMEVVEMALNRSNKGLVALLNRHGAQAVGLSGKDANLLVARKLAIDGPDLGWVGEVQQVNAGFIASLSEQGYIPVICSVAGGSNGETYNVNADTVAGAVAGALKATKLLVMSDVAGLYLDLNDPNTLVSEITADSVSERLNQGTVTAGMIPKLEACLAAVQSGVTAAHLIDGTKPHSLLVELLTDAGVGTMILPEPAWRAAANFPLATLEVRP
ncbi:MAG: acetylglutamate kinase [bacterium]